MISSGKDSSEYKLALKTEKVAIGLICIGLLFSIFGAGTERLLLLSAGGWFLALGVLLVGIVMHSYAASRSKVKAAAESAKQEVYHKHITRGI